MLLKLNTKNTSTSNSSNAIFKNSFTGLILVANTFIWYLYSSRLLSQVTLNSGFSEYQTIVVWGINIFGTIVAAVFGFFISNKFQKRITFLRYWIVAGIPLSLLPIVMDITLIYHMLFFFALIGVYFGLGMPVSLAYFATVTEEANRSRLGGVTFLIIFSGVIFLGLLGITDIAINAIMLAACKVIGLMIIFVVKPHEGGIINNDTVSYKQILRNRPFILYFVPWIMFSIANYIASPIVGQIFPSLFEYSMLIENVLAGVFAVIGGFFGDYIGRRRLVLAGFILLGLGYGTLGLFPQNIVGWWFYTAVDGIAWGIFYTIFLMTIWGDISLGKNSEKYYAIGYLPFLFSIFTQLSIGTAISSIINITAIFSFTSVFLFLAVLPLAYAPETLPLKMLESRELKNYLKQAQHIKSKLQSKIV